MPSERQSAQMSEIENGRLGLYGTEHLKCNHRMTLGFKGLSALAKFPCSLAVAKKCQITM